MIDFRYHVVSIVAVFLALAIGIVLGNGVLQDPIIGQLQGTTESLRNDNAELHEQLRTIEQQAGGNGEFVQALSAQILASQLDGQRVVIVESPEADETARNEVAKYVGQAGGAITGRVVMQDKYLSANEANVIDDLTMRLKPQDLELPDGKPHDRAAAELANAVVTAEPSRAGQENSAGNQVLSGFQAAGYLSLSGKPGARATLAIVLAPEEPFRGDGADTANNALVALAKSLDEAGQGTVVAGPPSSATEGGLLSATRGDDAAADVSTVDAADMPSGRVSAILALAAETDDTSGNYGTGDGVDGFVPSPVPTPGQQ